MSNNQANGQVLREGAKYHSPFSQLLALGWCDGPTNGLVRSDERVWKFDQVDEIHNPDGLDLRVFTLAALPIGAWEGLVRVLGQYQTPNGPVWVLAWQFPSAADTAAVNAAVNEILQGAEPVEWVVAAEDLLAEIRAAKQVTAAELAGTMDWPAFLKVRLTSAPVP